MCKILLVPSRIGVPVSLSPLEGLKPNSTGPHRQVPWGFSILLSDPQAVKPDVGFRTCTIVWELLWYYCSPVCGSPTWWVWDLSLSWLHLSYHLTVAFSLSLDVGCLFLVGSRILPSMVVQQLAAILLFSQKMSACPPLHHLQLKWRL